MSGNWAFHNPVRVYFGRGCRGRVAVEMACIPCLVVTSPRGRQRLNNDPVLCKWANGSQIFWADTIHGNPDLWDVQSEIDRLADCPFKAIVAFGGGSVIDSAKALAVALSTSLVGVTLSELLTRPEIHKNAKPVQLYAIPSTAGTGSEVTPFSTIWDYTHNKKHSLTGKAVFPHTALVDPDLTDTLPRDITLFTGLDAINQALESIWNKNATPITVELATRALQLGLQALPKIIEENGGPSERTRMAECSLLAGLAISQTRTALCHSISYPLTAHFGVPHGLACAFTMPAVLKLNLSVDDGRFESLAKCLKGRDASAKDLLNIFNLLIDRLNVCSLVKKHVGEMADIISVSHEMFTQGRADNNLADASPEIIRNILTESWFFHG